MADALVNHTYSGLVQGVSEQVTESRHESQVETMENCLPHISRGILRRNPVEQVRLLLDKEGVPLVTEDFFSYTYDRGTADEQYLMLVGHLKWYIYKVSDGTLVGQYDDSNNVQSFPAEGSTIADDTGFVYDATSGLEKVCVIVGDTVSFYWEGALVLSGISSDVSTQDTPHYATDGWYYEWNSTTTEGVAGSIRRYHLIGNTIITGESVNYLDCIDADGLYHHPKTVYSFVTVGDYTWISNNIQKTAMNLATADVLEPEFHKTVAMWWVKSTGNVLISNNTEGTAPVYEGYNYDVNVDYLGYPSDVATLKAGNTTKTGELIAESMRDLLNSDRASATPTEQTEGPYYSVGYLYFYTQPSVYFVSFANSIYTFFWNGNKVGTSATAEITLGNYRYYTHTRTTDYYGAVHYSIARDETLDLVGTPKEGLWRAKGSMAYLKTIHPQGIMEANDSLGNEASEYIHGVVSSSGKLPVTLPTDLGDVLIKVNPSSSDESAEGSYWMRYSGDVWEESREAGLVNEINGATMPHTFLRTADGSFVFGRYGEWDGSIDTETQKAAYINTNRWSLRLKGDETSAPPPGFIGKAINDMFLHNNRLGFLAEDSIVLSELSEYGNFFPTTIRTIPSTDPIDLIVATTDVTGLKRAVPLSGLLMLMSDTAQFVLDSGGRELTPETATVSQVASYNYTNKAPARAYGNKVFFTTESGNGTQLFSFSTDTLAGGTTVLAEPTSLHVPTYLPIGVDYLQGNSTLGYLFMRSPLELNTIYVVNTMDVGGKNVQTAFHKWTFSYNIRGISILNNELYLLADTDGVLSLKKIALDVPADIAGVVYQDDDNIGGKIDYTSSVTLSKWYLKDGNGQGTRRGRLQIRTAEFSAGRDDSYKVEVFNDTLLDPLPADDEDWILHDATWDDTNVWDDIAVWKDNLPFFVRTYYNDSKVTISSNSETTFIRFGSNENEPAKGFELSTVNMEGLFRQRSQRI